MKKFWLFLLLLPFVVSAQNTPPCNVNDYTMKWVALTDNQVWGSPRKDRKPVEEKMKPHLNAALDWIKNKSSGVTGAKLAEHYNIFQHGTAADKYEGNSWYQATGRIPYYYTRINSRSLYCSNNRMGTFDGPAAINIYFNYVNELARPMKKPVTQLNIIPLRINGKVVFEVPDIKRSQGRVDYYEYPGPPPPTTVNYDRWVFIHGFIIRNSDQPLFIPFTRKEYLQQYLLEMEEFYIKIRESILKETNVMSPADIDKELKERIAEIKKFTEQGTWGYSKDNLEQRIQKAQEFYNNKKEEEANKIKNRTREADEGYAASVQFIKAYLQNQPTAELNKPVPYLLGDLLVNTLYDLSFTQRMIDRLEPTKPGTHYWGDTKKLCYINPAYFNQTLSADIPQVIAVEFTNLQDLHKHLNQIVANINRDFDFTSLQAVFPGGKPTVTTAQPQVVVKKGGNKFLPKTDSLKKLGYALPIVKNQQGNDVFTGMQSPGFNANAIKINYPAPSALKSGILVLLNDADYKKYLTSIQQSISNTLTVKNKTFIDDHILKNKLNRSEQFSRQGIGAWLSGYPSAALYFDSKACIANSNDGLSANNFAVHLLKSGYPEKALPILQYWLKKYPSNTLLLSNAATAYYYLGDLNRSMQLAEQCVAVDSLHPAANKILAFGYYKNGNKNLSKRSAIRCIKGGYDEEAISLLLSMDPAANISQLLYEGRKHGKEPVLLNRFRLPEAIAGIAEAEQQAKTIEEVLESLDVTIEAIRAKRKIVDMDAVVKANFSLLMKNKAIPKMQMIGQAIVLESWNQYRKDYTEHFQHLQQKLKEKQRNYSAIAASIAKKFDSEIAKLQTGEGEDPKVAQLEKNKCNELNSELDNYLKATAPLINTFAVRLELISRRHFTTVAHWMPHWLQSDEAADFHGTQISYLQDMQNIIKLYPLLLPQDCSLFEQEEEETEGKLMVWEEQFCPMKMSLGIGIAKAAVSCNSISIGGGELLQGEIELKMNTDWDEITEVTIAGGVGVEWNLGTTDIAGINAGASTKAYVKFGRSPSGDWNYEPADIGFKSEAVLTGKAGTVEMELKAVEVTVGLQSGVSADGVISRLPVLQ